MKQISEKIFNNKLIPKLIPILMLGQLNKHCICNAASYNNVDAPHL